jgi:hypothetical protein
VVSTAGSVESVLNGGEEAVMVMRDVEKPNRSRPSRIDSEPMALQEACSITPDRDEVPGRFRLRAHAEPRGHAEVSWMRAVVMASSIRRSRGRSGLWFRWMIPSPSSIAQKQVVKSPGDT